MLEGKPETYSPFRPGMTATVDIITKRKENIIAVPISAVVIKSDTTSTKKIADNSKNNETKSDKKFECVFIKDGDNAKLRVIKTGIQDDKNIEIISGLKKGDVVITGPYTTVSKDLSAGDKVNVAEDEKSKPKTK